MRRILWMLPFIVAGCSSSCEEAPAPSSQTHKVTRTDSGELKKNDKIKEELVKAQVPAAIISKVVNQQDIPDEELAALSSEQKTAVHHAQANYLLREPLVFLKKALERYDHEVKGYSVTFCKRERHKGKLIPPQDKPIEQILVHFREHCGDDPFSVLFDWQVGADRAQKVLYVQGENKCQMKVRPTGLAAWTGIWTKDPEGAEAMKNSYYSIKEFGLKLAMERTYSAMQKAKERGQLFVAYKGTAKVKELNDRECYEFIRTPYDLNSIPVSERDAPEKEGLNELILYVDMENWLQIGSVLKDKDGHLIAEYYFRDLKLNPEFKKDLFTVKGLE